MWKNIGLIKRILLLGMLIIIVIVFQSVIRTKTYNSYYVLSEQSEYERYSKEDLHMNVEISPILFERYLLKGEIVIGKDVYTIKKIVKMEFNHPDNDDFIRFDFIGTSQNEEEYISLVVNVFGSRKSNTFNYIEVNLLSQSKKSGYLHSERYTYSIKGHDY